MKIIEVRCNALQRLCQPAATAAIDPWPGNRRGFTGMRFFMVLVPSAEAQINFKRPRGNHAAGVLSSSFRPGSFFPTQQEYP